MIITEKGKYKALQNFKIRNSVKIGTMPKGTVFEITQVDNLGHKVIGPELFDWMPCDLPVKKVDE